MKTTLSLLIFLISGLASYSQTNSIRRKQYRLTGRIIGKTHMTPGCGCIAFATVIEFEVIRLAGMNYPNKSIGVLITCPESYGENFFEKGRTYRIVFSNKNQATFGWSVPNGDLLKKNALPFEPYAVSVKKLP